MSNDVLNQIQNWKSIIVVPLSTSTNQRRRGPSTVSLSQGAAGLTRECVALCHQVTTLDRSKFARRIGRLSLIVLSQVEDGLRATLDLL